MHEGGKGTFDHRAHVSLPRPSPEFYPAMSNPLTVALLGAAHGSTFVHFDNYDGRAITPAVSEHLHRALDHAIAMANSHAEKPEKPNALSRRR